MTGWTTDQRDRLGRAGELRIGGLRADDTLRRLVVIWAVRVDDDVYVRSVRGPSGAWYRGVQERHEGRIESGGVDEDVVFTDIDVTDPVNDRIDDAYARKYPGSRSSVDAINTQEARSTTMRVDRGRP